METKIENWPASWSAVFDCVRPPKSKQMTCSLQDVKISLPVKYKTMTFTVFLYLPKLIRNNRSQGITLIIVHIYIVRQLKHIELPLRRSILFWSIKVFYGLIANFSLSIVPPSKNLIWWETQSPSVIWRNCAYASREHSPLALNANL